MLNHQTHIVKECSGKIYPLIEIEEAERIDIIKRAGFYEELELGGTDFFICNAHHQALGNVFFYNHVSKRKTCYWPDHGSSGRTLAKDNRTRMSLGQQVLYMAATGELAARGD